jgi:Holliday junction resolvase
MGTRTENLLLDAIEELDQGFTGLRVDFGGGAGYHSPHDAGDLIVGQPHEVNLEENPPPYDMLTLSNLFVIEEKYKATDTNKYLQEDGEKFDAMIEFAEALGATPVLAVRWSSNLEWSPGAKHLLKDARDVRRTDAGNVSVKPERAADGYLEVEEFFASG